MERDKPPFPPFSVARPEHGPRCLAWRQVALLTTKKRQATVRAGPGCKLLSLDRGTFKRVLGPIEDVLHRNMETYNQVGGSTDLLPAACLPTIGGPHQGQSSWEWSDGAVAVVVTGPRLGGVSEAR